MLLSKGSDVFRRWKKVDWDKSPVPIIASDDPAPVEQSRFKKNLLRVYKGWRGPTLKARTQAGERVSAACAVIDDPAADDGALRRAFHVVAFELADVMVNAIALERRVHDLEGRLAQSDKVI